MKLHTTITGALSMLLLSSTDAVAARGVQKAMAARQPSTALPLRLATFNIRYAADAGSRQTNEEPWTTRAPLLLATLKETIVAGAPDNAEVLLGMQEVLASQLADIQAGLGGAWAHFGVGRDDGAAAGEFNPIFYRPAALRLLANETRWLSPTPDVPGSKAWGAGSVRIVNVGVFEHVASGRRFVFANTHLDNASSEARSKGVRVVLDVLRAVRETWGPLAVALTGDFNSEPGQDAYTTVVDDGLLAEVYTSVDKSQQFGEYETYTGFDPSEIDQVKTRIDFVWLGPVAEKRWEVNRYEVVSNVRDGVYISDHRPVVADVKIVA